MGDVDELARIEQELTPWVRDHVAFPNRELHGRCHKVVLRHLNVNREVQGDVTSFPVKLETGAEEEFAPLLHQIADAAQRDADDLRQGVQLYAVYAYYDRDRNYAVRKLFRVASSEEAEMDRQISPSEPANERGLVAQSMRHVEVMMRQMTVVTGMQFQALQRENQRLSEMNERFSQQQVDFLVLIQDTLNEANKRRLAEKKEEASLAIKEEALSKLSALLPVVVNRIAGQKVLPEEDPSFMLMASLVENMTDEQQQQFYHMLSDAQKMTLAEIFAQYEKKKSKVARGGMVLGKKNELPTTTSVDTSLVRTDVPSLDMQVKDRMASAETVKPNDPVLRKIEEDGDHLLSRMSKFSDFFAKKPPKGNQ